jgi:hypothetical protein
MSSDTELARLARGPRARRPPGVDRAAGEQALSTARGG